MTSNEDSNGNERCCPICIEDYNTCFRGVRKNNVNMIVKKVQLSCCQQNLCNQCLYSHIKSVMEEGITLQGRTALLCPFPNCGSDLHDEVIRKSFALQSNTTATFFVFIKENILRLLYHTLVARIFDILVLVESLLSVIFVFLWAIILPAKGVIVKRRKRQGKYNRRRDNLLIYKQRLKFILNTSFQEKLDLDLYERWSLSIALNVHSTFDSNNYDNDDNGDTDNYDKVNDNHSKNAIESQYTHITRCPTPNCPCLWLTNRLFYHEKRKKEDAYNKKSQKAIVSMLHNYFYMPIHPDREEEILDRTGYTNIHWLNPIDIDLFHTIKKSSSQQRREILLNRSADQDRSKDGRLQTCPLCINSFCNLCLRPWNSLHAQTGRFLTHTNITCQRYNKKSMSSSEHDEFKSVGEAIEARSCPGCGMRTNRTDGCNHMSCPCGFHWCYICECKWDQRHYGCSDSKPLIIQDRKRSDNVCIIS